jgi:hypothetical protein
MTIFETLSLKNCKNVNPSEQQPPELPIVKKIDALTGVKKKNKMGKNLK